MIINKGLQKGSKNTIDYKLLASESLKLYSALNTQRELALKYLEVSGPMLDEMINLKCGRNWYLSLNGVRRALEYVKLINADNVIVIYNQKQSY